MAIYKSYHSHILVIYVATVVYNQAQWRLVRHVLVVEENQGFLLVVRTVEVLLTCLSVLGVGGAWWASCLCPVWPDASHKVAHTSKTNDA